MATVTSTGLVRGINAGVARITASSDGKSDTAEITVVAASTRSLSGQLYNLDTSGFGELGVAVATPKGTFRSPVSASGAFTIEAPIGSDSVTFLIDATTGARRYHPVWIRSPADALPSAPRIVLIPKRWTIQVGNFSGTTIDISLEAAFTPYIASEPWAGFYYRTHLPTALPVWPVGAFPVAVAFDRAGSNLPIVAEDSVALWSSLREMEADLGRTLFRPVNFSELPAPGTTPVRGINVRVIKDLGGGSAGWAAGSDATIRGVQISLDQGTVRFGPVIVHEFVHSLGIGHTCGWRGVMTGCNNNAGRLTASDVAHIALQYRLEEVRRAVLATHSIFEAWQGQRVVELGLPPVLPPYDHRSGSATRVVR